MVSYVRVEHVWMRELTSIGSDVHTESCDWFLARVVKQLGNQEIIILHSHRKFLHVCQINLVKEIPAAENSSQ